MNENHSVKNISKLFKLSCHIYGINLLKNNVSIYTYIVLIETSLNSVQTGLYHEF